jgi:hypothetical protein
MKMMKVLASVAVLFVLVLPNASAGTIKNLATGQNGSGVIQGTGGSLDANWMYSYPYTPVPNGLPATGQARVVDNTDADWYGGWVPNSSLSSWIAPDPFVTNNGPAPYSFIFDFNLSGYNLSTVAFSGTAWTIDDQGTLSLNGCTLSTLGDGQWGSLNTFSLGGCSFNQGANTLIATITADDQFLEGIDLQGTITGQPSTTTPEPSSLILFGTGLLGLGPFRRKIFGR